MKTNLAHCFPEMSGDDVERIVKANFLYSGELFAEIGALWKSPGNRYERLISKVVGWESLKTRLDAGEGTIVTLPHLGNWELGALWVGARHEYMAMYRPPRIKELEALLIEGRQKNQAQLVPGNGQGLRKIIKHLRGGGLVFVLADQEPGDDTGVFAPFFGKPAYTMTLVQKLMQKTKASLFSINTTRINQRSTYQVAFAPCDIDPTLDEVAFAAAMNGVYESLIVADIEQYQWAYKRFKTQDPKRNLYKEARHSS